MSKYKIKNHTDLIRNDGCIINTNKEEYKKRIKTLKKNKELDDIIHENKKMKDDINELKDNMREILSILKNKN